VQFFTFPSDPEQKQDGWSLPFFVARLFCILIKRFVAEDYVQRVIFNEGHIEKIAKSLSELSQGDLAKSLVFLFFRFVSFRVGHFVSL
jgi:hypothetical protein